MIRKKKAALQEGAPGPEKERDGKLDPESMEAPPDTAFETPPEADTFSYGQVDFPIVGLGASAGGLAAFEAFFSGMPADTDP
ncbi:MAG: hypothetical protein WCO89_13045, partial [Syntrophus sp. (in: bacteria)]